MNKNRTEVFRKSGLVAAALLCALAGQAAAGMFTFGDSLSDPGNYYAVYKKAGAAPYEAIPSYPYKLGGGYRFTNGPTWAEWLAALSESPLDGGPALASSTAFGNYAVGGARARAEGTGVPGYNLGDQVRLFLADHGGKAPAGDLYAVWCGGNDLRDALMAAQADPAAAGPLLGAAAASVAGAVKALYDAGARDFFVPDVPDISLTPAVASYGPQAVAAAAQLAAGYNGALAQAVGALRQLPGVKIVTFDTNRLLRAMVSEPAAYGLSDASHPCVTAGAAANEICADPGAYFYWDGIHPTAAAHAKIARAMLRALKAERAQGLGGKF